MTLLWILAAIVAVLLLACISAGTYWLYLYFVVLRRHS